MGSHNRVKSDNRDFMCGTPIAPKYAKCLLTVHMVSPHYLLKQFLHTRILPHQTRITCESVTNFLKLTEPHVLRYVVKNHLSFLECA